MPHKTDVPSCPGVCDCCADETGFFPADGALAPLRSANRGCRSAVTGRRYASGDTWRVDTCQSCACHAGQITCFAQTCPVLACAKSVLKKGHCCPICIAGRLWRLLALVVDRWIFC